MKSRQRGSAGGSQGRMTLVFGKTATSTARSLPRFLLLTQGVFNFFLTEYF